jgi:hypothetical protein
VQDWTSFINYALKVHRIQAAFWSMLPTQSAHKRRITPDKMSSLAAHLLVLEQRERQLVIALGILESLITTSVLKMTLKFSVTFFREFIS